jgi:O-antigen ligase
MKVSSALTLLGLAATVALAPLAVHADSSSQQKNKNNWRNLGIGSAAVAGYGLLKHNNTATLLGVAGAAYSANRYEQDRHHQSQAQSARDARARYRREHRHYHRRHH